MSLRTEKEQIENHAAALEREADSLERELSDAAIARAEVEATSATAGRAETVAAMKQDEMETPPDDHTETPNAEMFENRAERLRVIAERLSVEDKNLLLAIAIDYEELAQALAQANADPA
jgi:hypothetical protein